MTDHAAQLNRVLHEQIPVIAHTGVAVVDYQPGRPVLVAPLAPNINHEGTVFGGTPVSELAGGAERAASFTGHYAVRKS